MSGLEGYTVAGRSTWWSTIRSGSPPGRQRLLDHLSNRPWRACSRSRSFTQRRDSEAVAQAVDLASTSASASTRDVVIDMWCYRKPAQRDRQPSYTQR